MNLGDKQQEKECHIYGLKFSLVDRNLVGMICLMEALKSMFITYLRADEGRRSHLSEVCGFWENLEAVSGGCVSISVVAMKEQEGGWVGVSADHGFANKKVTHGEVFHC